MNYFLIYLKVKLVFYVGFLISSDYSFVMRIFFAVLLIILNTGCSSVITRSHFIEDKVMPYYPSLHASDISGNARDVQSAYFMMGLFIIPLPFIVIDAFIVSPLFDTAMLPFDAIRNEIIVPYRIK